MKNSQRLVRVASFVGVLAAAALCGSVAQGATISYYLDQSNTEGTWPDGVNYLRVDISDSISNPGDIDFVVTPLATLTSMADSNFGIQRFGFNTQGAGNAATAANIIDPVGWSTSSGNLDGFGSFEVSEDTTGCCRQNPLMFSITGVVGDSPGDYAVAGAGGAQGTYYFAAHVAGMTQGGGSAYFGGNTPVETVVPVPAAAWLLLSALGSLGALRRRFI